MSAELSSLRQQLWRACAVRAPTLRHLQRSQPMVQGSCCLLRRKCGKPNCRCAAEYRRYQRARAVLVKRHLHLLALTDQMAQQRLLVWPEKEFFELCFKEKILEEMAAGKSGGPDALCDGRALRASQAATSATFPRHAHPRLGSFGSLQDLPQCAPGQPSFPSPTV